MSYSRLDDLPELTKPGSGGEEWRERIGRPCAGNSRLAFAVSVAFAPPLLHVVGEESGGFHFRGGKTTAEPAVWGGGDSVNGFLISYRATSNGLEGTCEDHCDALLCLDEMGQVDALGVLGFLVSQNDS